MTEIATAVARNSPSGVARDLMSRRPSRHRTTTSAVARQPTSTRSSTEASPWTYVERTATIAIGTAVEMADRPCSLRRTANQTSHQTTACAAICAKKKLITISKPWTLRRSGPAEVLSARSSVSPPSASHRRGAGSRVRSAASAHQTRTTVAAATRYRPMRSNREAANQGRGDVRCGWVSGEDAHRQVVCGRHRPAVCEPVRKRVVASHVGAAARKPPRRLFADGNVPSTTAMPATSGPRNRLAARLEVETSTG